MTFLATSDVLSRHMVTLRRKRKYVDYEFIFGSWFYNSSCLSFASFSYAKHTLLSIYSDMKLSEM